MSQADWPPGLSSDAPGQAAAAARRASVLVWLLGAAEMVVFGCACLGFVVIAMVPLAELEPQIPPEQMETVRQVYPLMIPMALVALALGFVPGAAYLGLGFGVRSARAWAINLALLLVATQFVVLTLLLLNGVVAALRDGNPAGMTGSVLIFGSLIALMIAVLRSLWRAGHAPRDADQADRDPWNEPTP